MLDVVKTTGRKLAMTVGIAAALSTAVLPGIAIARWHGGGIGPGAAVGLGLGAFALGSAIGAAPYYGGYGYAYPYYGPPAPYYGGYGYGYPYAYPYGY